MSLQEEVLADYRATTLSLRSHPLAFNRSRLDALGIAPAEKVSRTPSNQQVIVAGLVLLRQRPGTAKGITFVTLEDETGTVNLVVHQKTWQRYREVARHAPAWIARGRVESKDTVVHVIVQRLEDLTARLAVWHKAKQNGHCLGRLGATATQTLRAGGTVKPHR